MTAATTQQHKIQWLDANGLTKNSDATMEVHGAGCQHLKRYGRSMWADISPVEEWTSPKEFAKDYNGDFYDEGVDHEDGLAGCHPIAFYPCTGMVAKRTVIRGFEN